ncbi:MAG: GFA family protein [Gammaproteobacteria bacterium]|nr:GFA family protein [Gammaproteobacteria bacterium]
MRGSCQCDTVAFELTAPITWAHNCHCSRCRKARAAAFASNGFTTLDGIRWLRGSEAVTLYQLPQARFFAQAFCSRCGSPVPRADPGRGIAVIPYGCLDNAPDLPPQANIFVASKADWYVIADRLPQFAAARP